MRPIAILIALCLIGKSLQMVEFHEDETKSMNRLACVNLALKRYLNQHRNIWIFSSNLNTAVNSLAKVPLFITTRLESLRDALFVDGGLVVIFLEGNVDQDSNSLKCLQGIVRVGPIMLVCITDMVCSSKIYMNKIIEMRVVSTNLHYLAVDERGIIDIYEYTLTAEGSCGTAQLSRYGHCSDESTFESTFRRSVNFHKCPLRVATWPYPPYLRFCYPAESNQLCGVEGMVLDIVAKKVNATPLLVSTRSPDDVRRLVANRGADLGIGGLDTRPFEGVSYLHPYKNVQATIIASHSTWALERSLMTILQPLGMKIWMGIGVVIVSLFVLRILVPYFREIHALQLFGIFLGIPVPRQPRELTSRIYFVSLVLFGYLCSQSYLTNLTKMLATPQQHMIKTLDDLEHSVLQVTGPADSREKFKTDYPRIYSSFRVQDFSEYYDNMYELLKEGRSNSVYYIEETDNRITEWKTVQAINDRFNWYPVALVAPNTSAILRACNKIVLRIGDSGILTAYQLLIPKNRTYRSAGNDELTSSQPRAVLEFDDLKCVFILLVSGLGLSFVIFIIELMTSFIKEKAELKGRGKLHPQLSRHGYPVQGVGID